MLFKSFNLSTHNYFENLLKKFENGSNNHYNDQLLESSRSVISELKSIPDEVYNIYKVENESINSDDFMNNSFDSETGPQINEPSGPQDKPSKTFYHLYHLVKQFSKHQSFEKVYHNFKPYIKFLIQILENISNPSQIQNILIIDDSNIVLKSLKKSLKEILSRKKGNYEIIKASDGIEGLAMFKLDNLLNKSIKVIITDQNMTIMNGLDMFNLIKKRINTEDSPKLYISSSDQFDIESKEIKFLSKPVDKTQLRKALDELI